MEVEELHEILSQEEGIKLDFKREYKLNNAPHTCPDKQMWKLYIQGQWDEFIKDIIALTNGNVGTSDEVALLVIGVDDLLLPDGTMQLYDMSQLQLTTQQIIQKVNSACEPPIPNIYCEKVAIDTKILYVISIPPSPYLHETNRQLTIREGHFDGAGKLISLGKDKVYTEYTAFIRKGENISPASSNERRALEIDKKSDLIIMNENIKFELVNNLKYLLVKGKNGLYSPIIFYQSFKDNHKIELSKDLILENKYLIRLHIALAQVIGATENLSIQFLSQAIESGRYLIYDTSKRIYRQGRFLEGLHLLQTNIRKFSKISDSQKVSEFFVKYGTQDRNGYTKVSFYDILWFAGMLDCYEDVLNISIALLVYILGDKSRLDNLQLNEASPIAEETSRIEAEKLSDAEIIDWVLNSQELSQ